MHLAQRLEDRDAQHRRGRELAIWWVRVAAAVFTTFQTVLSPGDAPWLSWVVAGGFWASVAVPGALLRRPLSDRGLRRIGVASMCADVAVLAAVLANNLTDPAEPIYLVSILAVLEATMRWPTVGGAVSGAAAGLAAGAWTVAVYARIDAPVETSFATMRAGVFLVIGTAFGALTHRLSEQHRALERILDSSRDLIVTIDQLGTVRAVNVAIETVLGYAADQVVGRPWRAFLDPTQPDDVLHGPLTGRPGPDGESVLALRRFVRADGSVVWLELSTSSAPGSDLRYVAARDVTERLEVERQVKTSEQRFRSLFDHNPDAVYSLDVEGRFTSANLATERLTGYRIDELGETSFEHLIAPEHLAEVVERFVRVAAGEATNFETVIVARDGTRIDVDITGMPIVVDGEVVGVFGVGKDVTERRRLERELGHQASHDPLTGLPNRSHLEAVLPAVMGGRPATLLFVDLDRFKVVNDALGHRSGDELLVRTAERLARCLRTEDLLVRWAGDEFCVLLDGQTSEPESLAIADRLLRALAEPFTIAGREVRVSASVGVAHARSGDTPERLVQMADTAMYDAKREGRNRLSIFDPDRAEEVANAIDYENELRHAVHDDLLTIEYQPIVEMATGRIVAVESLLRWRLVDGGSHRPDEFIAVAESCGLIRDITRWVLRRACAQLADWDRTTGGPSVQVWVNVSALDLQDPELVPEVVAALDAAGLAADRLVLEVTESSLLTDVEQVQRTVDHLRRLGVALAIDDFGTGYSSMARLHRLRVAACKIDRGFVTGAPVNEQDAAIVRSLTELGGVFGFAVVGEGVETVEQARALQMVGCPLAQGYLFARPAPPEQLRARLAAGRVELPDGVRRPGADRALPSAG